MENKKIPAHLAIEKGFLVFGLQRSGTNYLQQLMRENFIECWDRAVWKHGVEVPTREKIDSKIVDPALLILYKNPYKWIESILARPADFKKTQKEYLKNPNYIEALAEIYFMHFKNWIKSPPDYISSVSKTIRYEDLLLSADRSLILDEIARRFHFERKYNTWKNMKKVPMSGSFSEERREYYLDPEKLTTLTEKQVSEINKILPDEIFYELNYERL